MAYEHENFLLSMGFKICGSCDMFSDLGTTYHISSQDADSYYWVFDHEDFSINIHDFFIKKDLIIDHNFDIDDSAPVSVSYIKTAHGERLNPYTPMENNMVYTCFTKGASMRFLLHGGYPYFSVGIEYKKDFIEKYIPETFGISKATLNQALESLNFLSENSKIEKIADEILSYKNTSPGSQLFYEVKAKELLTIAVNQYFNSKNKFHNIAESDNAALEDICNYIDNHYSSDISQDFLCKIALMSKSKLKHIFKLKYGITITEYIQRRRINVAEHLLY